MNQQLIYTAIDILKRYEPLDGYHLAFSGGKDSVCCKKLCDLAGVKYRAVYSICTVESKDTIPFIKKFYPDVTFYRSGLSMFKLIEKKGLPTRVFRYCCSYLKENSGNGKLVLTGIRSEESNNRKKRGIFELSYVKKGTAFIHPIKDWTSDDVWDFILFYKLPTPDVYSDCKTARGGCIGCPLGKQRKHELDANPKYKAAYLKAINKALANGIYKHHHFKDAQDVYNWWVSNKSIKEYLWLQRQTKLDL
jgi:phosphoadenosine phosphosulfate reductase